MALPKRHPFAPGLSAIIVFGFLAACTAKVFTPPAPPCSASHAPTLAARDAEVWIAGVRYGLEVAISDSDQERGLAGRAGIDLRGGMIFVFPELQFQEFVMRDCAFPIDLIYLDGEGTVVATHEMKPEPARTNGELASDAGGDAGDVSYNARLPGYASGQPARFALEVRAGTIAALHVRRGDIVGLDTTHLTALATNETARRSDTEVP